MAFRTVVVTNRSKLDLNMNYLVIRGEREIRIFIPEISILILQSTAISMTNSLMVELVKQKVKVISCDEKYLPCYQLVGFNDNYHSAKQIYLQTLWKEDIKCKVWTNIIKQKISNQSKLLRKYNQLESALLEKYLNSVIPGDTTNREGLSAKVYFNALFGQNRRIPSFYNSALNYGYAIILSAFCREITACGCITQLGIWHNNEFNPYNLASDLMEPYRIIVDDIVLNLDDGDINFKDKLSRIFDCKVVINDKNIYLDNAIEIYVKSVINALNNQDETVIKFYSDYELPIYENNSDV